MNGEERELKKVNDNLKVIKQQGEIQVILLKELLKEIRRNK